MQFAYNQRDHSCIGINPFENLYRQVSQPQISLATPHSKLESLNQMSRETHDVLECAKQCMRGAQEKSEFFV
jgi:hypothetical protein